MIQLITKYFPDLTSAQKVRFEQLYLLYEQWNKRINLISRKDFGAFYEHHVLHSLSVAGFVNFPDGSRVLDAGTGGGFPGIPLAILWPDVKFHLVDSVGKKILAVKDIVAHLHLHNVTADCTRIEAVKGEFDYVVSRAVAPLEQIVKWTAPYLPITSAILPASGIFYLKGGEVAQELTNLKWKSAIYPLKSIFEEPYFETKLLLHLYR